MKLNHKIIAGFFLVTLLILVTGNLAINVSEKTLKKVFIEDSVSLAVNIINGIDKDVQNKIEIFQEYSRDSILRNMIEKSNRNFNELKNIQTYITKRNQDWISIPKNGISPFMQNLINNDLSNELREKSNFYEDKYGYKVFSEIFVTNKYGANIAQTGKTTDYRQDDEEWWQIAKREGLYIRDVEYDESSDSYTIDIGIRFNDKNGNFIGVMKVLLNIEEVLNIFKKIHKTAVHTEHPSTEYRLITRKGKLIYSSKERERFFTDVSDLFQPGHLEDTQPDNAAHEEKDGVLTVHIHSTGYQDYKGLGWVLMIEHKSEEFFAPVTRLRKNILVISLAVTILGILIGLFVSSSITKRLTKLRDAAIRIGKGDMDVKIDVKSKDEIGQLASEFIEMAKNLKASTVKRAELIEEVDERKQAEAKVYQKQQELIKKHEELNTIFRKVEIINKERQKIMDSVEDMILLVDDAKKIKRCNRAFEKFTEKPIEEILGINWEELLYGKEPDVISLQDNSLELHYTKMHKWFALDVYPFEDSELNFSGTVIMLHETTKIKHITEELINAYEELKSTQAKILQREKMASIGQLAAGVAHEINNPMGFISSNIRTLDKYVSKFTEFIHAQSKVIETLNSFPEAEKLKEKRNKLKIDYLLEDVKELIKESNEGAERVKYIVQNLKTFSRIDEAEYKDADINECIESTLNIVWNELKYKTTIEKDYGKVPLLKCYPQQLNQVFLNILINAAQAIEKQGDVKIKTWNGDDFINISISDTGSGIPKDKLNKIFEPFFTTKETGKGTGLGLSITYDIVKKHNGEITVESEAGKGTTFTIKIPVMEGE